MVDLIQSLLVFVYITYASLCVCVRLIKRSASLLDEKKEESDIREETYHLIRSLQSVKFYLVNEYLT